MHRLGFGSLFSIGTFDANAVAFGLGRQIGFGFTSLAREAVRIAGDSALDRTLGPSRPAIELGTQPLQEAVRQSVGRDPTIQPKERSAKIQERIDELEAGRRAEITRSDLANRLTHQSVLQEILSRIGGFFSTHDYVGFGSIAKAARPTAEISFLGTQRVGNVIVTEKAGHVFLQVENAEITSVLGATRHVIDTSQYFYHLATDNPAGVTNQNAFSRRLIPPLEKIRDIPPLNFFK